MVARWNCTSSSPTNVTRVRSLDPPSYEGIVCCLFFSGSPVSLPPQKITLLIRSHTRTLYNEL